MTREEAINKYIIPAIKNTWNEKKCKEILEALEPKTGHWMKSYIGGAKVCSVCNAHMGLSSFKFCPNCGAKMESEDKV